MPATSKIPATFGYSSRLVIYISDPCKRVDLLDDLHMQLYKARVNHRYSRSMLCTHWSL